MRVTHAITRLDVGGAQTHVAELVLGQRAVGLDVSVVAGMAGPASARLVTAGVPVTIVPELGQARQRAPMRRAIAALRASIAPTAPDIIHGHSSHAGLAARLAARSLRCASVYTAHGWPFQRGASLGQRVLSVAGEFVGGRVGDAVIVLTEAERERALRARIVAADRLYVVPNGIADVPPALRQSPDALADSRWPTIVMVARFAPPKLQAEVIEVLRGLTDLAWTAKFVGDGPTLASVEHLLAQRGALAGRVELLGHRDDVDAIIGDAHVGVLWSRYEGLPISVMEYMRAGLCCVASDLPGTRSLFGAEPAGLVAATPTGLAGALRSVLSAPGRRASLGELARQRYERHYALDALVERTTAVYTAVLGNAAG